MSLKTLLLEAYREVHLSWDAILETVRNLNVTLQPGRENLILVYNGTFNPPHKGHVDVLLSGLRPEADAAAVVILPCEDYLLQNKLGNDAKTFKLQLDRRADVLEAIPGIPKDRVWVWRSTYHPFQKMVQALQRIAQAAGLTVAFSHMIGPDNLRLADPLAILPYFAPRLLVTNKARHVPAHFLPSGIPVNWVGFGQWSCNHYSQNDGEIAFVQAPCDKS